MKFSIVVNSAPHQGQSAWSAYRFTCAVLDAGHEIHRVFFYQDGVWNGADNNLALQDEQELGELWSGLGTAAGLDLVVCVSAARRRGIFDADEAAREDTNANLRDGFALSGLGQYAEALLVSDRTITFGGQP